MALDINYLIENAKKIFAKPGLTKEDERAVNNIIETIDNELAFDLAKRYEIEKEKAPEIRKERDECFNKVNDEYFEKVNKAEEEFKKALEKVKEEAQKERDLKDIECDKIKLTTPYDNEIDLYEKAEESLLSARELAFKTFENKYCSDPNAPRKCKDTSYRYTYHYGLANGQTDLLFAVAYSPKSIAYMSGLNMYSNDIIKKFNYTDKADIKWAGVLEDLKNYPQDYCEGYYEMSNRPLSLEEMNMPKRLLNLMPKGACDIVVKYIDLPSEKLTAAMYRYTG